MLMEYAMLTNTFGILIFYSFVEIFKVTSINSTF